MNGLALGRIITGKFVAIAVLLVVGGCNDDEAIVPIETPVSPSPEATFTTAPGTSLDDDVVGDDDSSEENPAGDDDSSEENPAEDDDSSEENPAGDDDSSDEDPTGDDDSSQDTPRSDDDLTDDAGATPDPSPVDSTPDGSRTPSSEATLTPEPGSATETIAPTPDSGDDDVSGDDDSSDSTGDTPFGSGDDDASELEQDSSAVPGDDDASLEPGDDDLTEEPEVSPTPEAVPTATSMPSLPPVEPTPGDESPTPILEPTVSPEPQSYLITGIASYEYVPYDYLREGLDYSKIEVRPIRGARVRLVDAATFEKLAQVDSAGDGSYSLELESARDVQIWIYSATKSPQLQVEDNTSDSGIYVLASTTFNPATTPTMDVLATSGWGGVSYSGERQSAPFAILDAAYSAALRFSNDTSDPPDFPKLVINWSINNSPTLGDTSEGNITTTHWSDVEEEIYVLGKEDVDTDEFDSHVIVHEWGHYFEWQLSRSDSDGGSHSSGDILDPRLAFGEGWANALSAMVFDPNTIYSDSMDVRQSEGFQFDLEDNSISATDNPGWYSEGSIQAILFDLYDDANETYDPIYLGLDPIYQVMIDGQKNTIAFTTIFSFIVELKRLIPESSDDIDALVTYHTANDRFGISPILDEWGIDESHDAGSVSNLPVYHEIAIGDSSTIVFAGGESNNWLQQNRYVRFTGDGSDLEVQASATYDIDLYLYQQGVLIDNTISPFGVESVSLISEDGETYVLQVIGWNESATNYQATVEINSISEARGE